MVYGNPVLNAQEPQDQLSMEESLKPDHRPEVSISQWKIYGIMNLQ